MIFYDGLIFDLQQRGGISTLFKEILLRMPNNRYILEHGRSFPHLRRFKKRRVDPETFEIFHSTYYTLTTSPVKNVTTVHDFVHEKILTGPKKQLQSLLIKRAVRSADRIICVSQNTFNDLVDIYGSGLEDRACVIHNGCSKDDFFSIPELQIKPYILFVGPRSGYKNFDVVVEALKSLPTLAVFCVGGGQFSAREVSLLNNNIPGRFCWKGFVSKQELNILYNQATCLVYPSTYEGFGIPILEAMSAGCAVACSNLSSLPEVGGTAPRYFNPLCSDDVRDAIEYLSIDENRKGHVKKGLLQSYDFSWDNTFQKTKNVSTDLLSHKI